MATKNVTYRSYSMEYGTFVGLSWGALFLSYVEGIIYDNALLILLCFMLCGVAFVLPFVLAFRLNRKVFLIGENLSYLQGLIFSISMFMYACLLNGLIVYAYFQFMDDGSLFGRLNEMLTMPEMTSTYKSLGMGEQYAQMIDMMKDMSGLSALDKALIVFNNNFFYGLTFSFVVAIVASYNLKRINNLK
ncbi:MAG: DUF4199 domain-containing protein [Bacteroidaceae bacterium]|nr:DUF4199 domain-containing protein [Bacteroidaceae bacterium]MBR0047089.1 DUF4199 domain-containing protein [Bacteroidaceae bacterium]